MSARASVSLRGLRTFCIAARHESFSAAADELFLTPGAVSRQIKSLEEELDLRLFDRNARDLKLTGNGQALFSELEPLVASIDDVVASFRKDRKRSLVRVSVQPFFASEYFVPRLAEFTAANPQIDIRVSASDESSESLPADAALSIRLFRSPPPGAESRLIFPMRLVAAGSQDLATSLRVDDRKITSDFPLIVHESYPKAWKQWSKRAGVELPRDSKVTRLDSMIAVVRAVEQGIGAALVPIPIAEQWFRQKTIVRLFDEELIADVSYFLIWQDGVTRSPGVAALRDWIVERFAESA